MKKILIKVLSLMFMFGALSTSAIAVDKLHFVVPGGGWRRMGVAVLEVPERL